MGALIPAPRLIRIFNPKNIMSKQAPVRASRSSSIKNPARSLLTQEQYIKTKAVLNKIREQNGNVVDGKYSAKEMKVAFGMTDSDGDGKLSKEEITQVHRRKNKQNSVKTFRLGKMYALRKPSILFFRSSGCTFDKPSNFQDR